MLADNLLMVALKQTDQILLQAHGSAPPPQPQLKPPCDALQVLATRLSAAPSVVAVGRRLEFHQAVPTGFLAVVLSRCAAMCGANTTIWRDALLTSVTPAGGGNPDEAMEVSIGQEGPSCLVILARCAAAVEEGGQDRQYAACFAEMGRFYEVIADVVRVALRLCCPSTMGLNLLPSVHRVPRNCPSCGEGRCIPVYARVPIVLE